MTDASKAALNPEGSEEDKGTEAEDDKADNRRTLNFSDSDLAGVKEFAEEMGIRKDAAAALSLIRIGYREWCKRWKSGPSDSKSKGESSESP